MGLFISLCKSKMLAHHEANVAYAMKEANEANVAYAPKGIVFACPEIDFVSSWGSGHN